MATFLQCPICEQPFSDPRMMPTCFHTLCYGCLKLLVAPLGMDDIFNCPVCTKQVHIPETGADGFPRDVFITTSTDQVSDAGTGATSKPVMCHEQQGPQKLLCSNSEDGDECKEPEQFCSKCNEYLCKACSKAHRKFKTSKSHELLPVQKLNDEVLEDSAIQSETPRCPRHNKKLKLYCSNCQCAVCSVCCRISHQAHVLEDISRMDEETKSKLHDKTTALQGIIADTKGQKEECDRALENLCNQTSAATAIAQRVSSEMTDTIGQMGRQIESRIRQIGEDIKDTTMINKLDLHREHLESLSSFIDRLVNKGTIFNRLACLTDKRSYLEQFENSLHDLAKEASTKAALGIMDLVIEQLGCMNLERAIKLDDTDEAGAGRTLKFRIEYWVDQNEKADELLYGRYHTLQIADGETDKEEDKNHYHKLEFDTQNPVSSLREAKKLQGQGSNLSEKRSEDEINNPPKQTKQIDTKIAVVQPSRSQPEELREPNGGDDDDDADADYEDKNHYHKLEFDADETIQTPLQSGSSNPGNGLATMAEEAGGNGPLERRSGSL